MNETLRTQLYAVALTAAPGLPWEQTIQGAEYRRGHWRLSVMAYGSSDSFIGISLVDESIPAIGASRELAFVREIRRGSGPTRTWAQPVWLSDPEAYIPKAIQMALRRMPSLIEQLAAAGREE